MTTPAAGDAGMKQPIEGDRRWKQLKTRYAHLKAPRRLLLFSKAQISACNSSGRISATWTAAKTDATRSMTGFGFYYIPFEALTDAEGYDSNGKFVTLSRDPTEPWAAYGPFADRRAADAHEAGAVVVELSPPPPRAAAAA